MAWQDCSRYSFCSGERPEIMCVFTSVSMCLCAVATACLRVCCGAKCGMIAKERERGNRCRGILKASADTHAHKHTCLDTLPISSGLLCSFDNTISSYVCLRQDRSARQTPPAVVQRQHFFFFFHQWTCGIDFFNLISKTESENKSITELLGQKPSYISQHIGFRKHISTNILFPLYTGWRLDTKWLPGEKRLWKEMLSAFFYMQSGVHGSPVSQHGACRLIWSRILYIHRQCVSVETPELSSWGIGTSSVKSAEWQGSTACLPVVLILMFYTFSTILFLHSI